MTGGVDSREVIAASVQRSHESPLPIRQCEHASEMERGLSYLSAAPSERHIQSSLSRAHDAARSS